MKSQAPAALFSRKSEPHPLPSDMMSPAPNQHDQTSLPMKTIMTVIGAAALILTTVAMTGVAAESQPNAREQGGLAPAQKPVSLTKPYPAAYRGAPTDRISVQYAVIEIGRQAGLRYDWDTSARNTDDLCRRWIYPEIRKQPFQRAMTDILSPLGLSYEIRDGTTVVLTKP